MLNLWVANPYIATPWLLAAKMPICNGKPLLLQESEEFCHVDLQAETQTI